MYLLLLKKAIYCHLLASVSMVNSKPTIDNINILIKAQSINIVTVSDNETYNYSERLAFIQDSERYYSAYCIYTLQLDSIPETPETLLPYALKTRLTANIQQQMKRIHTKPIWVNTAQFSCTIVTKQLQQNCVYMHSLYHSMLAWILNIAVILNHEL